MSDNLPLVLGLRDQRAQTTAEYVGMLLVVAAAMVAVSASGIGDAVRAKVDEAIVAIATDEGFGETKEESGTGTGREPSEAAGTRAQPAGYRPHLSEARQAASRGSPALTVAPAVDRGNGEELATGAAGALTSEGERVAAGPQVAGVPSPAQWWRGVQQIGRGLGQAWRWLRGSPKPAPRPPVKPAPAKPAAPGPTSGQLKQFRDQIAKDGPKSIARSRRTIEKRLREHEQKLNDIRGRGGNPGSVEREIRNFKSQIKAIDRVLKESR